MIRVDVSTDIVAPSEEVFAYTSDSQNDPAWMEEVTSVRKTSEGPIGVGSTFENHVEFMGRTIEDSQEIIEYEPNTRLTFVQTTGPIPFKVTYLYHPFEGGTHFSMHIEAEPGRFFKLATPLVRRRLQTQFTRNVGNLGSLFERDQVPRTQSHDRPVRLSDLPKGGKP